MTVSGLISIWPALYALSARSRKSSAQTGWAIGALAHAFKTAVIVASWGFKPWSPVVSNSWYNSSKIDLVSATLPLLAQAIMTLVYNSTGEGASWYGLSPPCCSRCPSADTNPTLHRCQRRNTFSARSPAWIAFDFSQALITIRKLSSVGAGIRSRATSAVDGLVEQSDLNNRCHVKSFAPLDTKYCGKSCCSNSDCKSFNWRQGSWLMVEIQSTMSSTPSGASSCCLSPETCAASAPRCGSICCFQNSKAESPSDDARNVCNMQE